MRLTSTALLRFFLFIHPATTEIYTLSLHDALPISSPSSIPPPTAPTTRAARPRSRGVNAASPRRSEEHTSELQSLRQLVCRLLLEKKNEMDGQKARFDDE